MDFWHTVLAVVVGVVLVYAAAAVVALLIAVLIDVTELSIRLIHRCGAALMNRITGMDTYTRRSEREKERDDWWKDA